MKRILNAEYFDGRTVTAIDHRTSCPVNGVGDRVAGTVTMLAKWRLSTDTDKASRADRAIRTTDEPPARQFIRQPVIHLDQNTAAEPLTAVNCRAWSVNSNGKQDGSEN